MRGKLTLYVSQYGDRYTAHTIKELREKTYCRGARISKMYRDKKDGRTVHVGYVLGSLWLTAYQPVELEA